MVYFDFLIYGPKIMKWFCKTIPELKIIPDNKRNGQV